MGFLDSLFGGTKKLKAPAADRIFAMTTAYITFETGLGMSHRNVAGIVFQPLATADFGQIVKDSEELLRGQAEDTGTTVETSDDQFGYRWMILRDDDEGPGFLVVLLVSFFVYVVSFFLMLALSRYREFSADRTAALITGRPSALSSALMRISGAMQRIPEHDLREAERMNAFFIVPTSVKGAVASMFATHPSMEKRIEALNRIEAQLQAGGAIAR